MSVLIIMVAASKCVIIPLEAITALVEVATFKRMSSAMVLLMLYHGMLYNNYYLDIDECALNISGCNQNCSNTEGSYNCICYDGYYLDDPVTCLGKL